ncbi:MAG: nucleotidyltransferase domain-containing protein [Thermoplasmata archaeon]
MDNPEKIFARLQEEVREHPDVLGFFLGGSRGKGLVTRHSDYDIYIVVKDGLVGPFTETLQRDLPVTEAYTWVGDESEKVSVGDFGSIVVFSLSGFERHAAVGSGYEWDRYNFAHIKVLLDKNDRIQSLVDEKGRLPRDAIRDRVSRNLDGYINGVYRSLKCFRDGNAVGARLEASRSLHFLLEVLFGIEGRVAPYYKYLAWELERFPLPELGMASEAFVGSLMKLLENGHVATQQTLFRTTERLCRNEGYGSILDDWGPDLDWIRTYRRRADTTGPS